MAACRRDPCGLVCILLTYLSVGYADYVIVKHILLPGYSGSIWCPFHAVMFNLIVFMLLSCHTRAVFSDPGMVPLPDTAIDFSDLRSTTPRKNDRGNEDWTVCNRCETYRPPRAHHCRICRRCIRRMDHHCPWINNCVGELNQKYFIQFLFYTGLASLYAVTLVTTTWLWSVSKAADVYLRDLHSNHVRVAHHIILVVESVLFGLFVMVIFYDQMVSIIMDETPIEQLRNRLLKEANREVAHTRKPKMALLREVFGRGNVCCWFFPCNGPPSSGGISYSYLPNYDV
ncbi:zf-DHHC domain-containing protein [Latimeria chalumnae]|uniref:Palmitoyltransferase n=1 Tax=Latimeria chalumnae TaxID=7897 RepID=H3A1C4_LATCH|nr:PREDICTED: palmitoyltransferase ZDHHC3-like [Latimeria chalumnae]|eukprot:XP_005999387.1 PREDICTED: palmitoyltransferase ZDHHC3-like [Latimeria chalumnae]